MPRRKKPSEPNEKFTVEVPKDLLAELGEIAKQDDRRRTALARIALREYVERRKSAAA